MLTRILSALLLLGLLAADADAQIQSRRNAGNLSATGSVPLDVAEMGMASIDVRGTFTGTVTFEVSTDGVNYVGIDCFAPLEPGTAINTTTAAGLWQCPVAGTRRLRGRVSAYTSGTVVMVLSAAATGGGGGGGSASFEGEVMVGAQPASDPHFVTCASGGVANPCDVTGTVAVTHGALTELATAISTELQVDVVAALPAGTNNIGDVDIASAIPAGTNNIGDVDLASAIPAGTNNIGDVDVATIAAGDNNIGNVDVVTLPSVAQATAANLNAQVVGNVAHDAAASGNPVQFGCFASSSVPANVSASDVSRASCTLFGALRMLAVDSNGDPTSGAGTAKQDETAFTPGTTQFTPIGGEVDDTATDTLDEGEAGAVRLTSSRAMAVTLFDTSGVALTASQDATHDSAALTAGPQLMGAFDDTATDSVDEGDAGSLRISANRNLLTSLRDAAGNERGANVTANNELLVELGAGAASIGTLGANSGVDIGDVTLTAGAALVGRVQLDSQAGNGGTPLSFISAGATEDEHAVCTAACNLYSILVTNTNAAVRYLKCENDTAANTAPGTDTPEFRIAVPGATTGAGASHTFPIGASFSTGLTCWLVTGAADSDVAEVAANELMVFYTFKQ